ATLFASIPYINIGKIDINIKQNGRVLRQSDVAHNVGRQYKHENQSLN
ncbi:hypothetical protein LX97_03493, partial [Nonlabens dokdonensis]